MIYFFEQFQLDIDKVELKSAGAVVPLEPQVFSLLRLLVENRDRMVGKDEIVDRIWNGRIVSDSAVASRVKSLRHALGDNGREQRVVKTIHGLGFRFVAEARTAALPAVARTSDPSPVITPIAETPEPSSRPTIAVLPFAFAGDAGPHTVIADALPDDLITHLSRLRWLFVISRASSFQLRGEAAAVINVRSALNVRYCVTGLVEVRGRTMNVSVELCDTQTNGILWAERFQTEIGAVHEIRDEIARATTSALELEIPLNEARIARLKSPEQLDAWAAYHLAMHRMYRFTKEDNAAATTLLERAVALEPDFARAYAGLSFTHFQTAFLHYGADVAGETLMAQRYAEKGLEHDPLDPFCNFTMGRSFLLHGDVEASLPWLDRANILNPNYAQGKYSRAWMDSLLGRGADVRANIDTALALSPLDPLRYAMLGVRSLSHVILDELPEAAHWADQSARAPGAHVMLDLIATAVHGMNGDEARARFWAESARARRPDVNQADFFRAFPFRDERARKRLSDALKRYGF